MSTLQNTITEAVKTAMKAREMDTVKILRGIQAVIKQVQIDNQTELNDKGILEILQKQTKQRQESLEIYKANGREDLAQKEQFEINVISQFLPAQLSEDKLITIINETISELSANSMKDMGRVMNAVKDKTAGQADPSVISGLVKKALTP
ncbi:GatB/YqeY domain-containing protein [Moraxella nasovis]|uniref:GatB/YqeY domain-containing protein n=1 Tax=Moraxella nasovis TaxID=2904121 RepID=UPI001F60EB41|nr:GatB/YqeY domain-containing protein [Moraxella nasovis]UNU73690.1 GatB/YqeY domain-containing protein [Moraxella nasovis]